MRAMTDALVGALPRLALTDISIRSNEFDIVPVAQSGLLEGFGRTASINDPASEHSLTQKAIVKRQPIVHVGSRDENNDPYFSMMLESALLKKKGREHYGPLARRVQSWVAIPVVVNGDARAALSIASLDYEAFSGPMIQGLTSIANVVGLSMIMIEWARGGGRVAHASALPATKGTTGNIAAALGRLIAARTTIHNVSNLVMPLAHDVSQLLEIQKRLKVDVREREARIAGVWQRLEGALRFYHATGDRATQRQISLDQVVDSTIDFMKPRLTEKRVRVTIRGQTDPFTVFGNEGDLIMALMNVVGNCIDAFDEVHDKRSRNIAARRGMMNEQAAFIKIEDNANGIPPALLPHVFDEGFTSKAMRGGTGLGLFHARQVVESFGGEITIKSRLGKGTTVTILIRGDHVQGRAKSLDRANPNTYIYD